MGEMMINHGLVKKDGKVTGYNAPSELYAEQKRIEAESRTAKSALSKQADIALRAWARWRVDNIGYGDSSITKLEDVTKMPARSTPPHGCREAPDIVLQVIRTFSAMGMDAANTRQANILGSIYLKRSNNETIEQCMKRLEINISTRMFRLIREKFANIFFKNS